MYKNFKEICKHFLQKDQINEMIEFIKSNVNNEEEIFNSDLVDTNFTNNIDYMDNNLLFIFDKYGYPNYVQTIDLTNLIFNFIDDIDLICNYFNKYRFTNLETLILPKINQNITEKLLKNLFNQNIKNKFPFLQTVVFNKEITEDMVNIILNHFNDYTYIIRNYLQYNIEDNFSNCKINILNTGIKEFCNFDYVNGYKTCNTLNVHINNNFEKTFLKIFIFK